MQTLQKIHHFLPDTRLVDAFRISQRSGCVLAMNGHRVAMMFEPLPPGWYRLGVGQKVVA